MSSIYTYDLAQHFGGAVRPSRLEEEISAAVAIDSDKLKWVTVDRNVVSIVFNAALTDAEKNALDQSVIPAHDGNAESAMIDMVSHGADNSNILLMAKQTEDRILFLPDANDTIVGRNTEDTLTAKTINCQQNVVRNVGNVEIGSDAAIDATKIANGSVSNSAYEMLSGATSNIQTQLQNRAALHHSHTAQDITNFDNAADARIALQKGSSNGVASLDESGKVPASQLNLDGVDYQGTWNASNNSPTLTSGSGVKGHYYVVHVSGSTEIDGIDDWQVSDWIIFNGVKWEKADHSQQVSSVAGKQGAVTLVAADVIDFQSTVSANEDVVNIVTHAADSSKHRKIDDAAVGAANLWSASKISNELAEKSSIGHTHSATSIDGLQSQISANTAVQASVAHVNDASKHRVINDAAAGSDDLWSASKIYTELNSKSDLQHTHEHTEIVDFDEHVGQAGSVVDNTAHRLSTDNPHQVTKAQLGLANVANVKCKYAADDAPDFTEDATKGYSVGSRWFDVSNNRSYVCVDASTAAAKWHRIDIVDHSELAGAGNYSHAEIDAHLEDESLHRVIDDESTQTTSLWSAAKISGLLDDKICSADNVGTGVGIYAGKNGQTLHFKRIRGAENLLVASTNAVHCYNFENSAEDSQGNTNGSVVGGVSYVDGKIGTKAAHFDGVSGTKVNLGAMEVPNQTEFSVSLWFKVDLFSDARLVAKAYGTSTYEHIFALMCRETRRVGFRLSTDGIGSGTEIHGSTLLEIDTWYHTIAWYDGTRYKIYLNGVEDAQDAKSGLVPLDPTSNTCIGNQPDDAGGDRAFHGTVDQVCFWDKALSPGEIASVYNNGAGSDVHLFSGDQISLSVHQEAIDHSMLANTGSHSHSEIDAHLDDESIHFTIADNATASNKAWSSGKISEELALKSTLAADETITGEKLLTAHAAIGADAQIREDSVLSLAESVQSPTTQLQALHFSMIADAESTGQYAVSGAAGAAIVQNSGFSSGSRVDGFNGGVYGRGDVAGNLSTLTLRAVAGGIYKLHGTALSAAEAVGGEFFVGRNLVGPDGTMTVKDAYAVRLLNADKGLKATNHYGLFIEKPTEGQHNYTVYTSGGLHSFGGPLTVQGNVDVAGKVDGRDVASDGIALDKHLQSVANPHNVTKSQIGLGNVPNLKVNLNGTAPPTDVDGSSLGYSVGSLWIDTKKDSAFVCVGAEPGAAAQWKKISIVKHDDLQDTGTNSHAEIDAHISDGAAHRQIDDSAEGAHDLWSASKIASELSTRAAAEHLHSAADVSDFNSAADARIAAQKGVENGLATLDSTGKVPASQLSVSSVVYQGTWRADTNVPSLSSGSGTAGHYYVVSVAGTTSIDGESDWQVGDWIIFNGQQWQKSDNSDAVTSVANKQGAVTLVAADLTDFDSAVAGHASVETNTSHRSATNNPHAVSKGQVGLGNVPNLKAKLNATSAPTSTDDASSGYSVGSVWVDTSAKTVFQCVSADNNAAIWRQLGIESHNDLSEAGENSHADIDAHIANGAKHRVIDDNATSAVKLWSSSNIQNKLETKAAAQHTHHASAIDSGTFADARISQSSVLQHQGALLHQEIDGAGDFSHAQIDAHIADTSLHPTIDDDSASESKMWSSSKIASELDGKSTLNHTHSASDIVSGTFANGRVAQSNVTQHQAAISHDGLLGYKSSEHVDHADLSINAGQGLSGGGALTVSRTVALDLNNLSTTASVNREANFLPIYDVTSGAQRKVLVKNLNPYVGTEIGDLLVFTGSTYTPLSRGNHGDVLAVNNNADEKLAWISALHNHTASDIVSGTFDNARISASNVTQHESAIDHNSLQNYSSNRHIDHSAVQIKAGDGLRGGGSIITSRSLEVSIVNLSVNDDIDPESDYVMTQNAYSMVLKKVRIGTLLSGGGGDVTGPSSVQDSEIAVFSGTSGKVLKSCGRRDYGPREKDPTGIVPQAGDRYYNTAINHEMCYDAKRKKWLSVAVMMDGGGRNGTTGGGQYYRRWNGMIMDDFLGPHVAKGTIVRMGYSTSNITKHTMQVCINGEPIAELYSKWSRVAFDDNVNADFEAGILSCRNKSGSSSTSHFQSVYYYKLRA